ncbi:EamA family transporter [Bradyrhizobium sp. 147]|uniref:DMT family transporter n=1 Tax=unclassified Bradyrhizobium TaxID=2631580 RepID=UPI001FFB5D6C|nr:MULTISPECIES: EamA family transporter [unclassified Bradyrhizobium]MCK1543987.1 EamA family transporter [Bradyrhizobium sp. 179]MCK1683597.1 EamA family transporter [Bradyrhizobium sp. 147]
MDNRQGTNIAVELALLVALATLWGGSYTFIKLGVATIPPVTLIAARTTIAGLLLLAVMRARGIGMPTDRETWQRFAFQAVLNSVIPWTLIAWGERHVDAALATILNSAGPIFTFLLTALITRHEATTPRKLFGVIAGMAGILLIVGVNAFHDIGSGLLAEAAIVAATICYACAAIFGRSFKGLDPMAPAAGSLLAGAAVLIPASLAIEQPWTLSPSPVSVLALLALAVFSTAAAFAIYFRLIQTLGSVGTTAQAYLRVPIGVAISIAFLGETLSRTAWIGLACVVLGVAAMTIPAGRPASVKSS